MTIDSSNAKHDLMLNHDDRDNLSIERLHLLSVLRKHLYFHLAIALGTRIYDETKSAIEASREALHNELNTDWKFQRDLEQLITSIPGKFSFPAGKPISWSVRLNRRNDS